MACCSLKRVVDISQKFSWRNLIAVHNGFSRNCPNIKQYATKTTKSKKKLRPVFLCTKDTTCTDEPRESFMVDPSWEQPSVIIIGAGMAGLSAANRLMESGICNIIILEATDRPGGRIHSCWLGDTVVELGADKIWGAQVTNPVYIIACQEGLLNVPYRYNPNDPPQPLLYFTSDGRAVESTGVENMIMDNIMQQARDLFAASPSGGGVQRGNLQHFMGIRMQQHLLEFPSHMRYDSERILFGMTNSLRARWGADLNEISALQFGSFKKPPGADLKIPLGFIGVMAPLLRGIPKEKIFYDKPVLNIKWGAPSDEKDRYRIVVRTCDGCDFHADYCIVTLPLGVLKNEMDNMFCPKLPEEKREAINNLGLGHQCKVFLEYGRPFWCSKEGTFRLAWSHEELLDRGEWTKGMAKVEPLGGSTHTICFSVGGPEAKLLETCAEEEIAIEFTRILRKFSGDNTIPHPCNVLRTSWTSDKYFQGATVYMSMDTRVGHIRDLVGPSPPPCSPSGEPPILLFAGEATAEGAFGSVHGARASGILQANRIVELTKQYKGRPVPPPSKVEPCDVDEESEEDKVHLEVHTGEKEEKKDEPLKAAPPKEEEKEIQRAEPCPDEKPEEKKDDRKKPCALKKLASKAEKKHKEKTDGDDHDDEHHHDEKKAHKKKHASEKERKHHKKHRKHKKHHKHGEHDEKEEENPNPKACPGYKAPKPE